MKKLLQFILLMVITVPLLLYGQEENAIRRTIQDFQEALRIDDFEKAASFMTRDFARQIGTAAPDKQGAPAPGDSFLHQSTVDFIKKEMDGSYEDCQIISISQQGVSATAELKPRDGKVVRLNLLKDATGSWKISSPPRDISRESQAQDEAQIDVIRAQQRQRALERRRARYIADAVVDEWRR